MTKIIALTDYKDKFGSKHFDIPYRSGFDKALIKKYFNEQGYDIEFVGLSEIKYKLPQKDTHIVYTSSEDDGYYYKSYIEDIIYGLSLNGFNVIPTYKFLRANNNKVFMHILHDNYNLDQKMKAKTFGCLEELHASIRNISFPTVIKSAEGASGRGVFLAETPELLFNYAKKITRTKNALFELWDFVRAKRHKGYIRESKYRKKFIIQNFIPGLKNDWKIYIFGQKLYIFYRPILKGRGIKASGGGYDNYSYALNANAPKGLFDFAWEIYKKLDIPHISMDIAFDDKNFYLLEFQALYFGTAGIPYSDGYFYYINQSWKFKEEILDIEKVYADSIIHYIENQ